MKNYLFRLLSFLFATTLCVGFTSCNSEDDDELYTSDKLMSKKWVWAYDSAGEWSGGAYVQSSSYCLYFLDGQYGVNSWYEKEVDSYFGSDTDSGYDFFEYTIQGNSIVIKYFDNSRAKETLIFKDSYLQDSEYSDNKYNAKSLTSDDNSAIRTFKNELKSIKPENGNNDITTILGQWRLDFGQNSYVLLTFKQDGTMRYYEYDKNKVEEDKTYTYAYSDGWLQMSKESKPIQVIKLTSTELILKDWPDGGSNIFRKVK